MAIADRRRQAAPPARQDAPPAGRTFPGWRPLLVQMLLIVGAALCYFAVRGLTQSSLDAALDNARLLVRIEADLGIEWEHAAQALVIDHETLVRIVNAVYMYGHWPVIALTLGVLFARAPDRFYLLRNAMFVSGAIGLVIFALVPVAPPRLGVLSLIDTITEGTSEYRTLQPPGLINRYAALPSLHFGWNLLVGIVVWHATRNRWLRATAVALPVAMAFAVVATANHYVLDVVAGGAVALVGLAIASRLPAVIPTPAWARPRR
ncbi:MAG TPA: phosphatase PAP2 family protein [Miltoncostaeaceae bacterium]|nr:phosphatase PAP2 family protein [Miltoncostaeaceae bacterium]